MTTLTEPCNGLRDAGGPVDGPRPSRRGLVARLLRWSPARTALDLGLLAAMVAWVGARGDAFTGFPKGNDVWGHLSKTQFVIDNWPHVSWNYEWYAGMPSFQGSYPPGYHVLVALVASAGGLSVASAMTLVAYAGVLAVTVGVYGAVRAATSSRPAALVGAALLAGAPTFWSQTVTLGLYPRFLGLACTSLALAGATRLAVRGGRLTSLGTALALAAALSMHPIIGVATVALVTAVLALGPRGSVPGRLGTAAGVIGVGSALAAYFYLPLVLLGRSQSPWTDQEKLLSWRALWWPARGSLDGLSPLLLPAGLVVLTLCVRVLRRPELPLADKAALGVGISWLAAGRADEPPPPGASPAVYRYARWRRRVAAVGFPLRVVLVLLAGVPVVLAYGTIGYLLPRFRFYVNGLQPYDLLVYPAYLLAASVGIGLGVAIRLLPDRHGRPRHAARQAARRALLLAGVAVGLTGLMATAAALPAAIRPNNGEPDRTKVSRLPPGSAEQRQYRIAGASDSTSNFVNAVSGVPQIRGYQDHGNLQLDYQHWLEESLLDQQRSPSVRRFLLDWYGVRWVLADAGAGPVTPYQRDRATYEPLETRQSYSMLATFAYRYATPVLTARTTRTALVVGDQAHYDLVLRALALADVDSRRLVLVHGPEAADDVTAADLSAFDTVLLYGAQIRSTDRTARLLRHYVEDGGNLVVDDSDAAGPVRRLAAAPNGPLPISGPGSVVVERQWDWSVPADPVTDGVDVGAFGPPSYAGGATWTVEAAGRVADWARPLLRSHGAVVGAAGRRGAGPVAWTGLGLPYHAAVFGAEEESGFLGRLLGAPAEDAAPADPAYEATFVHSGRREITVGRAARGVLLKEHDAPDWHASVDGREVPIWSAGPGMMWVPLPSGHDDVRVVFEYRLGLLEKSAYAISGLALLLVIALAASRRLWRRVLAVPRRLFPVA
ncbi:MAG: DUF6541 family protein [Nocardioidaceae bacterium]